tara:strand:+ start:6923 stop:7861 length:939 start_codon:yes stop_codon:yes gene_type:complete
MSEATKKLENLQAHTQNILNKANEVIIGKEEEIRLCMISILAKGHVLLEGAPGLGKTSLIKTLAKLLGLKNNRIQFTNDMLPADILGSNIYNKSLAKFEFHPGPIFAHFVLADEINRATPKTQSACLQAMEEHRVNMDGFMHELPLPFFLFATQNPSDNVGTFPLPESQLDRFLMRIEMKTPSREAEKKILKGEDRNLMIEKLNPLISSDELKNLQDSIERIHVSDMILDYLLDLVSQSRTLAEGLSPRASQDFLKAAKANAFIDGRDFVIPEDLQRVGVAVMNHRLGKKNSSDLIGDQDLALQIIESTTVA